MKLGILSQDIRLYSTSRLFETAKKRGHDTEVVSYLRYLIDYLVTYYYLSNFYFLKKWLFIQTLCLFR